MVFSVFFIFHSHCSSESTLKLQTGHVFLGGQTCKISLWPRCLLEHQLPLVHDLSFCSHYLNYSYLVSLCVSWSGSETPMKMSSHDPCVTKLTLLTCCHAPPALPAVSLPGTVRTCCLASYGTNLPPFSSEEPSEQIFNWCRSLSIVLEKVSQLLCIPEAPFQRSINSLFTTVYWVPRSSHCITLTLPFAILKSKFNRYIFRNLSIYFL